MNPSGNRPPFLGGYWRFIRRFAVGYFYLLLATAFALLVLDCFAPNLRIFELIADAIDQL